MESVNANINMDVSSDHKYTTKLEIRTHNITSPDDALGVVTIPTEAPGATDDFIELGYKSVDNTDMGNSTSMQVTGTHFKTLADGDSNDHCHLQPIKKKDLDDLLPATDYWTCDMNGTVKLRMSEKGPGSYKPTTIPSVFEDTVAKYPNSIALAVKRNGQWRKWTYQQYYHETRQVAKALIKLGLEPYHGMGILGFNSPEWFMAFNGAIFAVGKATGIYATNSPEACHFVLSNCQANVVMVEDNVQLQKIIKVWDKLPHLKAIIQYTGEVSERREHIYSWDELLSLSNSVPDSTLMERQSMLAPNICCSLIYTSGTTGNPKAVMISHDNCTWTSVQLGQQLQLKYGTEILVSYLPLSHIAAQMLDIIIPLKYAISVYFAQPDALKGTLVDTFKEVRPTGLLAVPRVWEKIQEKMEEVGRQSSSFKRKIAIWAKGKGLQGTYAKINHESLPWGWSIANFLVFKNVKKGLGLDRSRIFGSAAAPIMKETLEFFASFDIRIDECFGMSETTGPHTFCCENKCRLTSVGQELNGVETKIENPDDDGNGEICCWGRHVFMGYLNEPEKTRESIQSDLWIHSGDIGKRGKDGFLYITGRIKELIITAGGENIAPISIEGNVKEALPVVSNCMLIGDKRKFLSLLITLKTDMNPDTNEPLDTLSTEACKWIKSIGSSSKTVHEAINDKLVQQAIQAGVDKANKKAVSRAAIIQKWFINKKDFSIPGGELGPTLKLRRQIVLKQYEKIISELYED